MGRERREEEERGWVAIIEVENGSRNGK